MNSILKNRAKIIEEDNTKYILKPSEKNIEELFEYLRTRNFNNIPKIIDKTDNGFKYEYINEVKKNNYNKHLDLARVLSNLHYKTAYYKDVSKNKYREIYEKLSDKIEYIEDYYTKLIEKIEMEIYPSPSHYLIQRNYSIINGAINYSKKELKSWFKLVENKPKERVVVVHNNPKLEHLINGEEDYLINWDNYVVDTPILDLYKLYNDDKINSNFTSVYEEYSKEFTLTKEEKKLFFILISIPPKIEELDNELLNTKNIKQIINKIYYTNELITSINLKEEENN